jgi:solute carrier family 25 citrate transporter 1
MHAAITSKADGQGKLSAPRSMLAGLGAGMMEAIIAVTPSETIKCVWQGQKRGQND